MAFAGFNRMIAGLMNNVNTQISRTDCRVGTLERGALHEKQPRAAFPLVLADSLSFEREGRAVTLAAESLAESYRLALPARGGAPDDALFWNGERLEWRRVADQPLNSTDDVRFSGLRANSVHGNFYGTLIGNVHGQLEGLVMTEHQPNISSLGVLRSLDVLGVASARALSLRAGTRRLELRAAPLEVDAELVIPPPQPSSLLGLDEAGQLRWLPTAGRFEMGELGVQSLRCGVLATGALQLGETRLALPATGPAHRQILVHEGGALVWTDLNQSFDQTLNSFDRVRFAAVQAEVHGNVTGNLFGSVMSPHQPKITQVGVLDRLEAGGARLQNQGRLQLCENSMYGGERAVSLQAPSALQAAYSIVLPAEPPAEGAGLLVGKEGRCAWTPLQPAHANLQSLAAVPVPSGPRLLAAGPGGLAARELRSESLALRWEDDGLRVELPQPLHPSARATFEAVDTQRLHVNGETSVVERNLFVNGTLTAARLVQGVAVQRLQRVPLRAAGDLDAHLALLHSLVEFDLAELVSDERHVLRLVDSRKFMDLLQLVDGDSFEIRFLNRGAIAGALEHDDSFESVGPIALPPHALTRVLLVKSGSRLLVC